MASPDGGALVRVIAGDVAGQPGPGITHTPIALVHVTIAPGWSARVAVATAVQRVVYALSGRARSPTALRWLPASSPCSVLET